MDNIGEFLKYTSLLVCHGQEHLSVEDFSRDLVEIWDKKSKIQESLKTYFNRKNWALHYEQYNEVLLLLGSHAINSWFFKAIFKDQISDLKVYKEQIEDFRIKSAIIFGNFKYAYRFFSSNDSSKKSLSEAKLLWDQVSEESKQIFERYKQRKSPPIEIEPINLQHRYFVSEINRHNVHESEKAIAENVRTKALFNSSLYLASDYLDVYVATSMRKQKQFQNVATVIKNVFSDNRLKQMNLRYFDPTLSDANNRLAKGLIEALMLKRAKVTLYLAQESDSLGKDSELASTLAQGKDVIILVPKIDVDTRATELESIFYPEQDWESELSHLRTIALNSTSNKDCEIAEVARTILQIFIEEDLERLHGRSKQIASMERAFFDSRANLLKEMHPLGLQVNLSTGVAHGILVVRTESDAAELIYRSLTNCLEFSIENRHEERAFLLREKITNSVFRVISQDTFLSRTFWEQYLLESKSSLFDALGNPILRQLILYK